MTTSMHLTHVCPVSNFHILTAPILFYNLSRLVHSYLLAIANRHALSRISLSLGVATAL